VPGFHLAIVGLVELKDLEALCVFDGHVRSNCLGYTLEVNQGRRPSKHHIMPVDAAQHVSIMALWILSCDYLMFFTQHG